MADAQRTKTSGWTVDIARSRVDLETGVSPTPDLEAGGALMADLLPQGPYDYGVLRDAVAAPGESHPSLVVRLGYHADGGFRADAVLVPGTGRLFAGGGIWTTSSIPCSTKGQSIAESWATS